MPAKLIPLPALAVLAALFVPPATASEATDVAREVRLPAAVVETTFAQVDTFFSAANGPANRQASGLVKELTLKAIRSRVSNLDDSIPGKISETNGEEKHASYRASVRTTRHETTESRECVDNRVTVTVSEEMPAIKDGLFTFDSVHPKVTTLTWDLAFCRTPTAGGGWSDWSPGAF